MSEDILEKTTRIFNILRKKELFGRHVRDYFEVIKYHINNSKYAEDELYGWEKTVQINLRNNENFYIKTDDPYADHPKLIITQGDAKNPDTTIITDGDTLTGIICGRNILSGENRGKFEIEGDNTQASIIFMLLMLIGQEFREQRRQAANKEKGKNI